MNEENKKSKEKGIKRHTKKAKKEMKKTIREYKKFAIKGNVMDLAVGVVIGSAFTNIVNSLVSSTITPVISLLTKNVDLSTLFFTLSDVHYNTVAEAKAAGVITFEYGQLLNSIINFIIVSFTLFLIVKYLNKIGKEKDDSKNIETEKECQYCLSSVPIEATKCAYCTSELKVKKIKKA